MREDGDRTALPVVLASLKHAEPRELLDGVTRALCGIDLLIPAEPKAL